MVDIVDPPAGVQDLLPAHGQLIPHAVSEARRFGQTETERNDYKHTIDHSIDVTGFSYNIPTFIGCQNKQTRSVESQRGTFSILMLHTECLSNTFCRVGPALCSAAAIGWNVVGGCWLLQCLGGADETVAQ